MSIKYYRTELTAVLEKAFNNTDKPMSFKDLISFVETQNLSFNKSNFYRQLNKMQVSERISAINTTQGQMWEKSSIAKHPHLECQRCNAVSCLNLDTKELTNNITSVQQFQVADINILGICRTCIQQSANK
jgi:Fe2+ or Zn2+ uptake regulation protein